MSNNATHFRSRSTHPKVNQRTTHGQEAYESVSGNYKSALDQQVVDAVVGQQNIIPGGVDTGAIAGGAVGGEQVTPEVRSGFLSNWATFGESTRVFTDWAAQGAVITSEPVSDGETGDRALRVSGATGWLIGNENVPFDPKTLYRMHIRVRQVSGASNTGVYAGFCGVGADGVTLVNATGANAHSSQHYFVVAGASLTAGGGWVDYVGFVKGTAGTGSSSAKPDSASPGVMHSNTRFIRPIVIVNYTGGTGVAEIDFVSIVRIDNTGVFGAEGNVIIDSSGITIYNGMMTLRDEFGASSLIASGFSGSWEEFFALGLYNGAFTAGSAGTLAAGRTSGLPYWTVTKTDVSGTAVFTRTADTGWPGGSYIRFVPGGNTDKLKLVSDKVGVIGFQSYAIGLVMSGDSAFVTVMQWTLKVNWYRADGTTLISTTTVSTDSIGLSGSVTTLQTFLYPDNPSGENVVAPANARFATVEIEMQEIGSHQSGSELRLGLLSFREDPLGEEATGKRNVQLGLATINSLDVVNSVSASRFNGPLLCAWGPFTISDIPGTATTDLNHGVLGPGAGGGIPRLPCPVSGRVIGISVRGSAARTAGTATFQLNLNGTTTSAMQAVIDGTNTTTRSFWDTIGPLVSAGQTLGVTVTTSGFTPTTADYSVMLFVLMDVV